MNQPRRLPIFVRVRPNHMSLLSGNVSLDNVIERDIQTALASNPLSLFNHLVVELQTGITYL